MLGGASTDHTLGLTLLTPEALSLLPTVGPLIPSPDQTDLHSSIRALDHEAALGPQSYKKTVTKQGNNPLSCDLIKPQTDFQMS